MPWDFEFPFPDGLLSTSQTKPSTLKPNTSSLNPSQCGGKHCRGRLRLSVSQPPLIEILHILVTANMVGQQYLSVEGPKY